MDGTAESARRPPPVRAPSRGSPSAAQRRPVVDESAAEFASQLSSREGSGRRALPLRGSRERTSPHRGARGDLPRVPRAASSGDAHVEERGAIVRRSEIRLHAELERRGAREAQGISALVPSTTDDRVQRRPTTRAHPGADTGGFRALSAACAVAFAQRRAVGPIAASLGRGSVHNQGGPFLPALSAGRAGCLVSRLLSDQKFRRHW